MNVIMNKQQVFGVLQQQFTRFSKPLFKMNTNISHDKDIFYQFMNIVSEYVIYHQCYTLSTKVKLYTWDMYYQKSTNIENTEYSYIQFNEEDLEHYNQVLFDNNERVKFNYHVKNDSYEDIGFIHHDFTVKFKM